jgi:hypothetical protein
MMKKFLLMTAFLAVGLCAKAQSDAQAGTGASVQSAQNEKLVAWESAFMKDGKIWLRKGRETAALEKETRIGSSVVYPDGTVKLIDGSRVTLKDGDQVSADGTIVRTAGIRSGEQRNQRP